MRKVFTPAVFNFVLTIFLFTLFTATNLLAQKAIPELWGQRVHDEAKALTGKTIDLLETELKTYEDSTTNQIAVLIISTLDGVPIEDYAIKVAEKWKLGTAKNDNGVILIVAIDDHKIRIEVGNGLEGRLTDAASNQIIRNVMAPSFRRNEYDEGVIAGVKEIIKTISGEYKADPASTGDMTVGSRIGLGLFIFAILGLFTAISLFSTGCSGWGLYVFLIPFYFFFTWIIIGMVADLILLGSYVVGMPIAKILVARTPWGKEKIKNWKTTSVGGAWISGSGFGGSGWSGGGGGGGFSGGGGSFGGGGSSGSW
jgi:uncharacterized protein